MDINIYSGTLAGRVNACSSSAILQRLIVMSALCPSKTTLFSDSWSYDVNTVSDALVSLGCVSGRNGVRVFGTPLPHGSIPKDAVIDCGTSLSAFGALLPLCCVLKHGARLTGAKRLMSLINDPSVTELQKHGATIEECDAGIRVGGGLKPGEYGLEGSLAPLIASGLMMILPMMSGTSVIRLGSSAGSFLEANTTVYALKTAGIRIVSSGSSYIVPGGQRYRAIDAHGVEGDPLYAMPWLAANHMGSSIKVGNLSGSSPLPYSDTEAIFGGIGRKLNAKKCRDILPYLAIAAAASPGIVTEFHNVESGGAHSAGGVSSLAEMLTALGCDCSVDDTVLSITGTASFNGGEIPTNGDPSLMIALAVASTRAESTITVRDAERAEKLYPDFWKHYRELGGTADELK